MAQTYTDAGARLRMEVGNCPECGYVPTSHDGWGGPNGCSLTDNGVAQRLAAFRNEKTEMEANDFVWCPERWDGPGGTYDLGAGVVREHVCAQHQPGHTTHVCCCGATKED